MKTDIKTTHTPGPWEIRDVAGTGQMFSIMSPSSIPEGRYVIATFPRTHGTENLRTQEADADIIAAAPELLEALKMIVESEKYPEFNAAAPWYVAGLAAIAKAEGK